ncbi:MAG: hypothetical protein ACR2IT_07800 [Pirellulales bacterium]
MRATANMKTDMARRWLTPLTLAVVVTWFAAVCGPPAALLVWRDQWLAEVAGPDAQADWDAFRADMQRQSGRDGPVQRKVPKSVEPPERVWLRDYVHLAVIAWITLVGVLGGFVAALAVGVAQPSAVGGRSTADTSATEKSTAENQPARDRDHKKQHERDAQHTDERKHG